MFWVCIHSGHSIYTAYAVAVGRHIPHMPCIPYTPSGRRNLHFPPPCMCVLGGGACTGFFPGRHEIKTKIPVRFYIDENRFWHVLDPFVLRFQYQVLVTSMRHGNGAAKKESCRRKVWYVSVVCGAFWPCSGGCGRGLSCKNQ